MDSKQAPVHSSPSFTRRPSSRRPVLDKRPSSHCLDNGRPVTTLTGFSLLPSKAQALAEIREGLSRSIRARNPTQDHCSEGSLPAHPRPGRLPSKTLASHRSEKAYPGRSRQQPKTKTTSLQLIFTHTHFTSFPHEDPSNGRRASLSPFTSIYLSGLAALSPL